ncbi:sugar ABC transporter substrate-binding protein [Paenibacillus antibioticophila]|uniref:Sugar ABC transporter substrate-binding protein n=1 Tax=Paenibacillus antibioticophila TaxID=1274374 RepID=A0A920CDE9_9BACL|nr:sugar ABC transporter substrate-binding protein [Paenibacillus antibioticophila]GIO35485.1 sugar ABC transporter substrate-binding protein [Paenibacillus antibioticophila]
MTKKKSLAALSLSLAFILALVGCGQANNNSSGNEGAGGKTVLEYYTWTDEEDYMTKVVEVFNSQNSDIEVHMNTISNNADEYNTKIMNNLSGGSTMDVYSINGTSSLGLYSSKGQLVELTDRIKEANMDVSAYGPSFQDITSVLTEGKYYALPYRTSQYALFYNKTLFEEAGIEYPAQMTWNEYGDLAKSLTKGEGADKQWGGYYADWIIAPLGALQEGSTVLDDSLDPLANWLDYLDRLYYKDGSHMSYKQMKAESIDWIKQFESGNVAMMINGEWTINMLKADIAAGKTDIEFDMAPMPLPEGMNDPITVGGVSTFIGINPQSKNADAAFKFVQFVTGEQGESIIAESSVLPAYASEKTQESFLTATGLQGSGFFFEANTVVENQPVPNIDEVNRVFNEQRDLFLFQEQDSATAIQNFIKNRQSVLNK